MRIATTVAVAPPRPHPSPLPQVGEGEGLPRTASTPQPCRRAAWGAGAPMCGCRLSERNPTDRNGPEWITEMTPPLRILLVDDEPLARLRLRVLLCECANPSAEVAGEAGNAEAALGWLDSNECDLVLLDVQMPASSGTDLAARL